MSTAYHCPTCQVKIGREDRRRKRQGTLVALAGATLVEGPSGTAPKLKCRCGKVSVIVYATTG